MKIARLPDRIVDVIKNNNGLRLYLNNLERGRGRTPRSWLYEGKQDTEVLRMWLAELEKVKSFQDGERIFQFDTSQLKKFGPQGEVKPVKELMDLVTEGFKAGTPKPQIFSHPLWQQAKRNLVKRWFKDHHCYKCLVPRPYNRVVDDMRDRDTLESNSGYPDFSRRKLDTVLQKALADARSGKWLEYPAILLFRNYNGKTRPVWMYPESTNIVEGSFTQPLKEHILGTKDQFVNPWRGYENVLAQVSRAYESGDFLSASDFSHTDAHFTKWQMYEVYDVIKFAFQERYWGELRQSMLHVCDIPLIINSKQWIMGDHGVSSGSNWTNDCETYMDAISEEFFRLLELVSELFSAIGDDVCHRRKSFDEKFADTIASWYQKMGFDVNAEKVTNEADVVKYLQRLTIRNNYSGRTMEVDGQLVRLLRGIYSTIRALNSSLNPEKFHSPKLWSKQMFACRQFAILENCVDHPLFELFVKFVCKGNAYLVQFAKQASAAIDAAQRQSRLLPGLNPTYNQEKRDKPMSQYASIAIASGM